MHEVIPAQNLDGCRRGVRPFRVSIETQPRVEEALGPHLGAEL
jgi:hypothetical protein